MKPPMISADHKKSFRLRPTLAAIFVCLLLSLGVFAKSLDEYQKSVRIAADSVDELQNYYARAADGSGEENPAYEQEMIRLIRTNLPATETIEWQGASVETGNGWLSDRLDLFERETDVSKKLPVLDELGERLSALRAKLRELENAADSDRSKDEDKRKLGEILRREEYQKPEAEQESWIDRTIKRIEQWLLRNLPVPDASPSAPANGLQSISIVLQIALYALVIGAIGFLVFKFAPFFAAKFRSREKREKRERVILGETIAAEESAATLFDDAEALAREGNLRGAIRKGYIALLCELNDRKVLGLARHKTNRDYLRDVRREPELYRNMNDLTESFERHWYGFEEAAEADWHEFRQSYRETLNVKK